MDTKLTVRVPKHLLANAKRYAQVNKTTLTALITVYQQQIPYESDVLDRAPLVRQMTGLLSPETSIDDYMQHLEDKYGGYVSRNVHDYRPAPMQVIQPLVLQNLFLCFGQTKTLSPLRN